MIIRNIVTMVSYLSVGVYGSAFDVEMYDRLFCYRVRIGELYAGNGTGTRLEHLPLRIIK